MRSAFLLPLCLAFVTTFAAVKAHASCMAPRAQWSLKPGSVIPPKATLYFAPWTKVTKPPVVLANKSRVPSEWSLVSENDAFFTYRLSFETTASDLSIEVAGTIAEYRVEDWHAPNEARATMTMGERITDAWTCSHTDIWPLEIHSEAQAFEVHWTEARKGGDSGMSVFPRYAQGFWQSEFAEEGTARLELGHSNCFGYNISEWGMETGLLIVVVPLYRDGSSGRIDTWEHNLAKAQEDRSETSMVLGVAAEKATSCSKKMGLGAVSLSTRLIAMALTLGVLLGIAFSWAIRRRTHWRAFAIGSSVALVLCGLCAMAAGLLTFPLALLPLAGGGASILGVGVYWARNARGVE